MTVDHEDRAGVRIVRLHGELGSAPSTAFLELVTSALATPGARIVVDLSDVPFMNSSGLGDLVRAAAQANIQEGRLILASPSPFVRGVLQASQLVRFFELAPTVNDALARLG